MAVHKLSILVEALGTGQASAKLKGIDRTIAGIGARANRGIGTAVGNIAGLAVVGGAAAFGGLAAAVTKGTQALREDAVVAAQTNAVLASTKGVAGVTAQQVQGLAASLSLLNGVDDNVVQGAENVLLTFTQIGSGAFPRATAAALDYAAATGTDAAGAAKLLGKALADPTKASGALRKAGVVLTAEQDKQIKSLVKAGKLQQAQAVVLAAVETRYRGVAKAQADADPGRRLSVGIERAEKALAGGMLPVINRLETRLTGFLADPKTMAGITSLGESLAGAAESGLKFAETIPWDKVGEGLGIAAGFAKTLVGAFTSMPPEVQATLIGLAGLNKLSGGAITGIASELAKGAIKGVLGINAGVVNVNAGVVNGGGGGPVPTGPLPKGGGGLGGLLKSIPVIGLGVTALAGLYELGQANQSAGGANINVNALAGAAQGGVVPRLGGSPSREDNHAVDNGLTGIYHAVRDAGYETDNRLVTAIRGLDPPKVDVRVNVTAGGITKIVTVASRYGQSNGSFGGSTSRAGRQ